MNEADEQFASRLAEDLRRYLGPEITLTELDLGDRAAELAHLRASCAFEGGSKVLDAYGDTRLEAYNRLILGAAELRLIVAAGRFNDGTLIGVAAAWTAGLNPQVRA
jgi:hypothetical protein